MRSAAEQPQLLRGIRVWSGRKEVQKVARCSQWKPAVKILPRQGIDPVKLNTRGTAKGNAAALWANRYASGQVFRVAEIVVDGA